MGLRWRGWVAVLVMGLAMGFGAGPVAWAHSTEPADPQASVAVREVRDWLTHLPNRAQNRVVSGQFAGYSGKTFSLGQVEELKTQTGSYPGLLGCDYGHDGDTIDHACNATLKDWSAAGGLVTVSAHLPNPDQSDWGGLFTKLATFDRLTDRGSATGRRWHAELDRVAEGLRELADAGVPVLFRPMHEMNGDSFWWSAQNPQTFAEVWRDMYSYLTEVKGLHNLLWVYAPDCSYGNRSAFYPGGGYADVVGLDCYVREPAAVQGYDELVALGKPFAFAEIGPRSGPGGSVEVPLDYGKWIDAIRSRFPATAYFMAWNDQWRPTANAGAGRLMNDSWTVVRGEIATSARTEGAPAPVGTPVPLADFETDTQGWGGYRVLDGPWSVSEWSARGARSLKADIDLAAPEAYLNRVAPQALSGYRALTATVRTAEWGNHAAGTTAKLYVRTGAGSAWYDGGAIRIGPNGAVLRLDLSGVADLHDVREIGVLFASAPGASGRTAVYVDDVTAIAPPAVVSGFESGTDGWTGYLTATAPVSSADWASEGARSLRAEVDPAAPEAYLNRRANLDLTGRRILGATVRATGGSGTAKLYVKTTASNTWYDAGAVPVGPGATTLTLNLAGVGSPQDIREIGVQFERRGGPSQGSVFVDEVTVR
ncbi:glycosyl hydrolase [Embleya sp. NPDC020886]|uniref:glycosyl hydrolase n=1 Tax=Embleya sp. NPDC020886 TaxID=3363980 RepID=UPI0037B1AB5E